MRRINKLVCFKNNLLEIVRCSCSILRNSLENSAALFKKLARFIIIDVSKFFSNNSNENVKLKITRACIPTRLGFKQ